MEERSVSFNSESHSQRFGKYTATMDNLLKYNRHVFVRDFDSVQWACAYLFAWQLGGPFMEDALTHIATKPDWELVQSLHAMRF
jgi:hypothetical protein